MQDFDVDLFMVVTQLWDLGYHSSDRKVFIEEFEMTDEQADAVCKKLKHLEDREADGF